MKNCDKSAPTNDGVLRDAPPLEFPDWSGMLPHRNSMTFEQAVRWNDETLALFPPKKRSPLLDDQRRCHAEFVL